MVPQINYVLNPQGQPIFVQLSVQEWETFLAEYQRLKALTVFKKRLKTALMEIRQIRKGQAQGTSLTDFLNELSNCRR
jgi:hypothetical protein